MVSSFLPALLLLGVTLGGVAGITALAHLLRPVRGSREAPPSTGGIPPTEHAVGRFHMRWYTVAMLFLAFDMEMIFMYPWTRVVVSMGWGSVIEMFTFLAVLLAGVAYAWREGALRWS